MVGLIEKVLFLGSIDLFRLCSLEELGRIATISEEASFAAGEVLIREGEPGDSLYLLMGGAVRVSTQGARITELQEGAVVGEMALLDQAPRSATIEAMTETTALRIDQDAFYDLVMEHSSIALGVMRCLASRLREQTQSTVR